MNPHAIHVDRLLAKERGVLKLQPTYARRMYSDGGRLTGGKPGSTFIKSTNMWVPERWIASCTRATSAHPIPDEGLSRLAGADLTLLDALAAAGERLLGPERYATHGPEFRVLTKILDGLVPICLHFHADDKTVQRNPKHFKGHRFGKDEAYYFLEQPKGPCPYTHVGLRPGTSPRELRAAIDRGRDHALELSPYLLQQFNEGFYLPAGIVHRPGTALTLEIQQPSDVSTRLDDHMGDRRVTPREMHPGFRTLDEAMRFIDYKASTQKDILDRYRLIPRPVARKPTRGATEDWIFPPDVCTKFSGKRLRVDGRVATIEPECYAVLVWKGRGRVGPHAVRAGDEFFVTHDAAGAGLTIERSGPETLELFKFFAAPLK